MSWRVTVSHVVCQHAGTSGTINYGCTLIFTTVRIFYFIFHFFASLFGISSPAGVNNNWFPGTPSEAFPVEIKQGIGHMALSREQHSRPRFLHPLEIRDTQRRASSRSFPLLWAHVNLALPWQRLNYRHELPVVFAMTYIPVVQSPYFTALRVAPRRYQARMIPPWLYIERD